MHEDQVEIGNSVVEGLERTQFPEWAGESIVGLKTSATTSHVFRIGQEFMARFPMRRADPAEWVEYCLARSEALLPVKRLRAAWTLTRLLLGS